MTTMNLRNLNLGGLRLPGLHRTPVHTHSSRGIVVGLGGTLLLSALGYLAFRLIERRPPASYRRHRSESTHRRRPIAVKAATISPQMPVSTNGELAHSDRKSS